MESKNTSKSSVKPSIMEEANRIYVMSKNGKLEEAMKDIETACDSNKNSVLLHPLQAGLFRKAALADKNTKLKKDFYHKAMISAQKAVSLSQNSLGFSLFYLQLLFRQRHFQEIVQEGERVLAIENPADPATEDYTYPEYDFQTPEDRIGLLKMSIRELVNQCKNPRGKTTKQISDSVNQVWQTVSGERVLVKNIPNYPNRPLNEEERKILCLWNSLGFDQKKDLLKVEVGELLAHLNSAKYISAKKILSEAITFYRQHARWKFWRCCCCDQKFLDSRSHLMHVENIHMEQILPEQTPILPEQLEQTWEQIIINGKWKPICASAVIMALEEKWEQCGRLEEDWSNREQWAWKYLLEENWPSSKDHECKWALHHIQSRLNFLVHNNFISAVHMNTLCEYSMKRLEGVLRHSRVWKQCLAQTHLCICSLGISDLQNIINFLNDILKVPRTIASAKNPTIRKHQTTIKALPPDITESIALNENILCLLPDAQLISHSDASLPSDDAILQWIITDRLREGQLEKWKHLEEERGEQGIEVLMLQNENILSLKDLCCEQNDLLNSKEAFKAVWDELLERKDEHNHQSFETILRKQQRDILEHQTAKLESSEYDPEMDRLKLGCISTVLKETRSTDYQEKNMAPIQPQVCDFSIFKNLDGADTLVKEAMQTVDKSKSLKGMKTDMQVKRTLVERRYLNRIINSLAARDYRTILTPLVKSYILVKLHRQANKDTAEKSTAISKDFHSDKKDQIERDDMGALDDADLGKELDRLRCKVEEEERIRQEKLRRYQEMMDEQRKEHLAQKDREAAQQAESSGLTASTASAAASSSPEDVTEDN